MAPSKNLSEFDLISSFRSQLPKIKKPLILGSGDDCAVLTGSRDSFLVSTDMLLEDHHFKRTWMSFEEIGYKSILVNTSDIAAMGGKPLYVLVASAFPKNMGTSDIQKLFHGIQKALQKTKTQLIGGDVNAGEKLILSITVIGSTKRFLTRSGAKVGDDIYVTGTLGGSALGLKLLQKKIKHPLFFKYHSTPPVRHVLAQKLASSHEVHSMIDISDGLSGDLQHILKASGVGASFVSEKIPTPPLFFKTCSQYGLDPWKIALAGGEDYELVFTASPRWKAPSKILGVKISKIGKIEKKQGLRCNLHNDHFQSFTHF